MNNLSERDAALIASKDLTIIAANTPNRNGVSYDSDVIMPLTKTGLQALERMREMIAAQNKVSPKITINKLIRKRYYDRKKYARCQYTHRFRRNRG